MKVFVETALALLGILVVVSAVTYGMFYLMLHFG